MENGFQVLVAEDNSVLSHVLQFNLESAGLKVTVANNGGEAKQALSAQTFDLLITDFQMPQANGDEVCRHAREVAHQDMPIIMCSAKGLELDAAQLKQQWGVTRVFYKPFSMREMLKYVQETLAEVSTSATCATAGG
jgi:CheY-like chemotaxis protein